jgi:hypothetical protein
MRWSVVPLVLSLAIGCGPSYEPPAPVLTLMPAAMRVAEGTATGDDHTRCLAAGASVEATVYIHQPTVGVIVTAFTPTPDTIPGLVVRLGSAAIASSAVRSAQPEVSVYRTKTGRGERVLRLIVPGSSPGVVCLQQVVVTQP